ncbi:HAD family phosphatase [Candidatus Dojkabacteria bacterium]|nr:HAD family phosphatase [Candidatus Dojkabacteria bacterium]
MGIKAVIFDFDGVFVDSWEFHSWALLETCKKFGIETTHSEIQRIFFGKTIYEATDDFIKEKDLDIDPKEFIKTKLSYDPYFSEKVQPFDQVVNFVKANNGKYRMCIASSTRDILINAFLKREKMEDIFEFVIDADDVERGKPAPDTYLEALKRLGLSRSEVVVVEDSVKGVQSAKAANLFVIALLQTTPEDELEKVGADVILSDSIRLAETIEEVS